MGPYHLQVFSSLVVIVAAAIIALFSDFLMRSNQQLRELAIELRFATKRSTGVRSIRQPG